MRKKQFFTKALSLLTAAGVILSGSVLVSPSEKAEAAKKVNLNGTYHAALGIQAAPGADSPANTPWSWRMAYFFDGQSSNYGTKKYSTIVNSSEESLAGTFTDTEIKGNGTYTVSLTGAELGGCTNITQLHVATDIPENSTITFSDVHVNINDSDVVVYDTAIMENEAPYLVGGQVILAMNHWRKSVYSVLEEKGLPRDTASSAGGYAGLLTGKNDNISITFTVSGFNYNNGETPSDEVLYETGPAVFHEAGEKITVGDITYMITSASGETGKATVVSAKNKAALTIPATVDADDTTLSITAIGDSAFAKNSKLKSITIGSKVTSIGKKAFSGCKKLTSINIKSNKKLASVGSSALKNVNKKCVVYAPKAKISAYKKLFKNKGTAVTVKNK